MVGKLLGGGVSERPKEHASKACDGKTVRGFKSLRHRQSFPPVSSGERLFRASTSAVYPPTLPGLWVGHASGLCPVGTLRSGTLNCVGTLVAEQVPALQPIDVHLCLRDVSSQCGRVQPCCVAVRARDVPTIGPRQLGGHLPKLIA